MRERKGPTARRIGSTRCAVLSRVGGYPIRSWLKEGGGYLSSPGLGYPPPGTGVPPASDWGTPPWKGHGTSGSIMGWRYYGLDMGYPPVVDKVKTLTSVILRMRAVKIHIFITHGALE